MKLKDLLKNLSYTFSGDLNTEVADLVYDFRKAGPGVEKDAPRKTGIGRFFELVGRDLLFGG